MQQFVDDFLTLCDPHEMFRLYLRLGQSARLLRDVLAEIFSWLNFFIVTDSSDDVMTRMILGSRAGVA
jgi:hypothetical protein